MLKLPKAAQRVLRFWETTDGGPGSGNWGHKGRPGLVGGSGAGGGKQYRGGRSDIAYVGSRKDWLNGLKGERQREAENWLKDMAKKHGLDPKRDGIHAVEQKIVNSKSDDVYELLHNMAEARNWTDNYRALLKDNLDDTDRKILSALCGKYGNDKDQPGMPDTVAPDWSDEDERTLTNLQIKAMGGPTSEMEIPDDLQYRAGLKERPKPKVAKRNGDWMDKEKMTSAGYLIHDTVDRAKEMIKEYFPIKSKDDVLAAEQEIMDDVAYNPSRIDFSGNVERARFENKYTTKLNNPHADAVYGYLALKGEVLGWSGERVANGNMTFDTLTDEENNELRDLLRKYDVQDGGRREREAFGMFEDKSYLFWKPMNKAEQSDAIRYYQLKDKALGGSVTPKEEYDRKAKETRDQIEKDKHPDKIGKNGKKSGPPMDFDAADHGSTNPEIANEPNDPHGPHHINCQTCVVAYEARRRGYDITAKGNTGAMEDPCRILARNTNLAWIDPETGKAPKFIEHGKKTAAGLAKWLDDNVKPGERYHFGFCRKYGGGHIVTVERDANGNIALFDPQDGVNRARVIGKAAIRQYMQDHDVVFSRNGERMADVLRVDNLSFNLDIVNDVLI